MTGFINGWKEILAGGGANCRSLELLQVVLIKKILNVKLYILLLVRHLMNFVREQKAV